MAPASAAWPSSNVWGERARSQVSLQSTRRVPMSTIRAPIRTPVRGHRAGDRVGDAELRTVGGIRSGVEAEAGEAHQEGREPLRQADREHPRIPAAGRLRQDGHGDAAGHR